MTKPELIEWLIQNDTLTKELIMQTKEIIDSIPPEFQTEAKDQQFQLIKTAVVNEICMKKGLTSGSVNEILDEEELRAFLIEMGNDPW